MKKIILILAVLSTLNSCSKQEGPLKGTGVLIIHHSSLNKLFYYEIDGQQPEQVRYNSDLVNCETVMASVIELSEGDHTITITNTGSCQNANGFTQKFRIKDGDCLISKISCSSSQL
jgi:hypothetical protein